MICYSMQSGELSVSIQIITLNKWSDVNMSKDEMQKMIESWHYWDAPVTYLNCNHFADEIELAFNDDDVRVVYSFTGCYKSTFNHVLGYDKLRPVREMTPSQVPYFLQDIEVDVDVEDGVDFYVCKINMFPLSLKIWCKNIEVKTR